RVVIAADQCRRVPKTVRQIVSSQDVHDLLGLLHGSSSVHTSEAEANPPLAAHCSRASDRRLGRFGDRDWGISWPPVGTFVTAYGENLMTADSMAADLLDLGRIEAGTLVLQPTLTDMRG